MFVISLKFSEQKNRAGDFMQGHKEWIKQGFEQGIFLLVGNLQPNLGGGIIAHKISRSALQAKIEEDPFVAENIVTAEIIEITPSKTDKRLEFLLA